MMQHSNLTVVTLLKQIDADRKKHSVVIIGSVNRGQIYQWAKDRGYLVTNVYWTTPISTSRFLDELRAPPQKETKK